MNFTEIWIQGAWFKLKIWAVSQMDGIQKTLFWSVVIEKDFYCENNANK